MNASRAGLVMADFKAQRGVEITVYTGIERDAFAGWLLGRESRPSAWIPVNVVADEATPAWQQVLRCSGADLNSSDLSSHDVIDGVGDHRIQHAPAWRRSPDRREGGSA